MLRLFLLACILLPATAHAQTQTTNPTTQNPFAGVGVILIIVCILRRKSAIGGWLMYFLSQLFLQTAGSIYFTAANIKPYLPDAWRDPLHYMLFLNATLMGQILMIVLSGATIMLLRAQDSASLRRVKQVLVVLGLWSALGIAIDAKWFPESLSYSVVRLLLAVCFWSYLQHSDRVRRVFLTHNWGSSLDQKMMSLNLTPGGRAKP